jgi:carbon monoxide dehydrogenase subunit G
MPCFWADSRTKCCRRETLVIGTLKTLVAQKQFVVDASQHRVWDLLGTIVYQLLPLEKVDIVNLTTFRAVLRWRMGFITFPFRVKGELVDISRPSSFGCIIRVKRGVIQLGMKVTFTLRPVNEGKTEVVCRAIEEGTRTIMGRIMRGRQQSFAENTFDSIEARLAQLC